jgi:hypothetical protein
MTAQFQLIMRTGPTPGKIFPVEGAEVLVGRESSNGVAINDAEVSRRHARLTLHGTAYVIQDLGSTNGTFVNGERITNTQVLNPGDSVSFGENISLSYEAAYDPNATMVSAPPQHPVQQPAAPAPRPAPTPTPRPTPAPYTPSPVPGYSGQVPAGPAVVAAPAPTKKKFPIWIIFLIIVLVIICGCAAFFLIIDQFKLWCTVVPFLVPLLGGVCP